MKCSKCGAELETGVAFCRECGTKVEYRVRFCRECGCEIPDGIKFCPECGAKININDTGIPQRKPDRNQNIQEQPQQEQPQQEQPQQEQPRQERPRSGLDMGNASKRKVGSISPKMAMFILGGLALCMLFFLIGRAGSDKSHSNSKSGTEIQSSAERTAGEATKPSIVMIDVGGLNLKEALRKLEDAGFEKVVTNASSDPAWSEDRWIVAEQSIAPGNNAYADDEVKLTCKKLCHLYLDLKSEGNLIFDTYDMEIWLDGKELGSVGNGDIFTRLTDIMEGQYELVIHKAGDDSVSARKTLNVEGDMTFKTDIAHGGKISFKNMETSDGVASAALKVDNVQGMVLSEAIEKLETAGFVNVRYEPYGDIWDKNNWIVTAQNLNAGTTADKNEYIQLDCIKLSEYFNNIYSGKYLDEVQKLAADEGYELRYRNTVDRRNIDENIASETEERKKRWKVDSAKQYTGKIAELSLTYEPTPEERAAEEARLVAESKAAEESRAKAESEAAERSKVAAESRAKAEAESRAEESSRAEAESKARAESEAMEKAKAEEARAEREAESKAEAAKMEKMVFPDPDSKLGKDIDSKGKTTWYYINVDNIRNRPVKKKWKSATVTDGVAEYLDHLENLGYTVKITDTSSRTPYSGFTLYETDFKVSKADFSWTMYLCIEDEKFVEYELDIYLPE